MAGDTVKGWKLFRERKRESFYNKFNEKYVENRMVEFEGTVQFTVWKSRILE